MKSISIKFTPKQYKELLPLLRKQEQLYENEKAVGMNIGNVVFRNKLGTNTILNVTQATFEVGVISKPDAKRYQKALQGKFLELDK